MYFCLPYRGFERKMFHYLIHIALSLIMSSFQSPLHWSLSLVCLHCLLEMSEAFMVNWWRRLRRRRRLTWVFIWAWFDCSLISQRQRRDSSTTRANLISYDKTAVKVIKVILQTPEGKTGVLDELLGWLQQSSDYIRNPFAYFGIKIFMWVRCYTINSLHCITVCV